MKRPLLAILTAAMLCSPLASITAHADDVRSRMIRFGYGLNENSNQGRAAKLFAEEVAKASDGKLKVRTFGAASLGSDDQMQSALIGGAQEMMVGSTATLVGITKEMAVWDTPFLFSSAEQADAVLDGPVGRQVMDKLEEKGLVGLVYWENGFRNLTNNTRPITRLEDFSGVKLRVMPNPVFLDTFKLMGANAVPLPLPELYTALETGTVDGQENPLASILSSKFNEVQKHVSTTNHTYNPLIVLSSKRFWDKLTADEQKLLLDAAEEVKPYQRKVSRDMNAAALEELKASGMTVTEVSDAERARMAEKLQPVIAKFTKETDEALVRDINAQLEKIRAAK